MQTQTTVKNLITEDKETYFNDLCLKENLITSILTLKNMRSQIHNEKIRESIYKDIEIIHSKKTHKKYAFYQDLDLIAYK